MLTPPTKKMYSYVGVTCGPYFSCHMRNMISFLTQISVDVLEHCQMISHWTNISVVHHVLRHLYHCSEFIVVDLLFTIQPIHNQICVPSLGVTTRDPKSSAFLFPSSCLLSFLLNFTTFIFRPSQGKASHLFVFIPFSGFSCTAPLPSSRNFSNLWRSPNTFYNHPIIINRLSQFVCSTPALLLFILS